MKKGDIVARLDEEARRALGIGLVIQMERMPNWQRSDDFDAVVLWPDCGLGWEDPSDLEIINEGR